MRKRLWILCFIALLVFLFYGMDQRVLTADMREEEFNPHCEKLDAPNEKEIQSMIDIFKEEDYDRLTQRVNEMSASMELLEDEQNRLEVALCLESVYDERELKAKINGYHSLLSFVMHMKEEQEDIQFEEITFTIPKIELYLQVEGTLKDRDEKVTIEHDFSFIPGDGYDSRELRLNKEKLRDMEENSPPFYLKVTEGLAFRTLEVLQNPIEKLMLFVNSFFTKQSEVEQKQFTTDALVYSTYFGINVAVITFEESPWETLRMREYYPFSKTYSVIERAKNVHEELPDYWYPKDAIERGDWNEIVAYYKKHREEMYDFDRELYDYIFTDMFRESSGFEDLIQKVKKNHRNGEL